VVLSGGVAYNTIFTSAVEKELGDKNIKLFTNEITASGDNGISFGQIYLAKYIQE
jgi:hydrogenase maturation protein HypF